MSFRIKCLVNDVARNVVMLMHVYAFEINGNAISFSSTVTPLSLSF
ncbi:MAG: hypothetical protein U0X39_14150 [Bacteroidales bacterium]